MSLSKDNYIDSFNIIRGKTDSWKNISPPFLYPEASNFIGHSFNNHERLIEKFISVSLFDHFAYLTQKTLHNKSSQTFVIVEGKLGSHEHVRVYQLQDLYVEVLVLVLAYCWWVQDFQVRVQTLFCLCAFLFHVLLELGAGLWEGEQIVVEGVHELALQYCVYDWGVG